MGVVGGGRRTTERPSPSRARKHLGRAPQPQRSRAGVVVDHESGSPRPPGVCVAQSRGPALRIHPDTGGFAVPGDSDATAPPGSERTRTKRLYSPAIRWRVRFTSLVPPVHLPSLTLGAYSTAFGFTPGSFHGDPSLAGDRVRTVAPVR